MFIAGPVGVEDGSIAPASLAAARPMGSPEIRNRGEEKYVAHNLIDARNVPLFSSPINPESPPAPGLAMPTPLFRMPDAIIFPTPLPTYLSYGGLEGLADAEGGGGCHEEGEEEDGKGLHRRKVH